MNWKRIGWVWSLALLAACTTLQRPALAPPKVSLVDLRVRDVALFEQRYGMVLRLQNPNPVELPIDGMAYSVRLNDVEFGHGVNRRQQVIPPYGDAVVELDVVSNLLQLLDRVRRLQAGQPGSSLKVSIAGDVSLAGGVRALPFSLQSEIGGADPKKNSSGEK